MMIHHEHHSSVDSTNVAALRAWRAAAGGANRPLLITADRQTAGRGRAGRPWASPAGGVWMSLAWPLAGSTEHYQAAPLAAGWAVLRALDEQLGLNASLKWPNDLLVHDCKVAGILCQIEPTGERPVLIVGIGVNADLDVADLGPGLRWPATTIRELLGRPCDPKQLASNFAEHLVDVLRVYDTDGLGPIRQSIEDRLAWRGAELCCEMPNDERIDGCLEGIDRFGRLVLRTHEKTLPLCVGEIRHVSRLPSPTAALGAAAALRS